MPEWFSAFVLILLVLDPIGNVPMMTALLRTVESKRRRQVILRECAIAFAVLIVFLAAGEWFLRLLGLSQSSIGIAGGIILFLIALRMIFESAERMFGGLPQGEPFIVPIAVPFLAGPSALGAVILLGTRDTLRLGEAVLALVLAMAVTAFILVQGTRITRALGDRGVDALQRLMGLILTAIAVQMFLDGVLTFMQQRVHN